MHFDNSVCTFVKASTSQSTAVDSSTNSTNTEGCTDEETSDVDGGLIVCISTDDTTLHGSVLDIATDDANKDDSSVNGGIVSVCMCTKVEGDTVVEIASDDKVKDSAVDAGNDSAVKS